MFPRHAILLSSSVLRRPPAVTSDQWSRALRTPLVGNDPAPPHLAQPREAVLAAWGILWNGKKALCLADDLLGVSEVE